MVTAEKNGIRREFSCGQWQLMGGTSAGWTVIENTCGQYADNIRAPYASYSLGGVGGDKHFQHTQGTPAATWTIQHNLLKRPAITVFDSTGREVEGDISHLSDTVLSVSFSAAFSGTAFLN